MGGPSPSDEENEPAEDQHQGDHWQDKDDEEGFVHGSLIVLLNKSQRETSLYFDESDQPVVGL